MAYTTDEKSTGLDVLTTLATGDLHIVGDVSDSGRAKAITENNLEITIANSSNFVDTLVANNYFTTELANDTNFVNELTTNTTFQSAVNNFVTVVGGGSSGASSGKPMSFYPKLGVGAGNSINGYQDREAVFSATSGDIYLADPTGNSQKRDILADWASATFVRGYALIGSYLYVLLVKHTATTDAKVYRYDASDLSLGGTLMTVSGATLDYATDIRLSSNGTHLFMSSDGGASANPEDIAKFSISGTTLTYVSTTTCTTTTASFGGAFSVDTAGNYYSTKDGETQTIYVCDSTGTQTSTQSESFQMSSIMNWGNTLYGYISTSSAWSKLYMPATDDSTQGLQTVSVTLTSADINGMYATPYTLIPAPGAGKINNIDSVLYYFDYGTTQYTSGGDISIIEETSGTNLVASFDKTFITGTTNSIVKRNATETTSTSLVENKATQITNATGAFASGDGTLKVIINYYTVTL